MICLSFVTENFGQEIYKVKGVVMDADTQTPLPDVRIESSKSAVLTGKEGNFAITVQKGDSIYISHVGYQSLAIIAPPENADTIIVRMELSINFLKPVIFSDIPSEDELKSKILETTIEVSREEENAKANLQNIRTLYSLGYRPEMNAMDNFRESMKPPQGVTFFSRGDGILKALKNLANPPSVSFPQRKQYTRPMTSLTFFKPGRFASDTLRTDTLATRKP